MTRGSVSSLIQQQPQQQLQQPHQQIQSQQQQLLQQPQPHSSSYPISRMQSPGPGGGGGTSSTGRGSTSGSEVSGQQHSSYHSGPPRFL
jgi:hypothetical protein